MIEIALMRHGELSEAIEKRQAELAKTLLSPDQTAPLRAQCGGAGAASPRLSFAPVDSGSSEIFFVIWSFNLEGRLQRRSIDTSQSLMGSFLLTLGVLEGFWTNLKGSSKVQ